MMRLMPPAAMAMAEEEDSTRRPGWRQYLDALEEERRKIQVFERELPLCLELVTQTIESYRHQMEMMSSGGIGTDHRPSAVLEEFIPMKRGDGSRSSSHEAEGDSLRIVIGSVNEDAGACSFEQKMGKEEEEEARSGNGLMPTADWLNLSQLWHHTTENNLKEVCMQDQLSPQEPQQLQPPPTKPIVVEARRPSGAFQPFCRAKPAIVTPAPTHTSSSAAAAPIAAPPSPPPDPLQPAAVAESSTTGTGRGGEGSGAATTAESSGHGSGTGDQDQKKADVGNTQSSTSGTSSNHRKTRRCWSPELHRRFLNALQQLGGSHVATPKQIREMMKVDGLTNDEVKSHLQKYRLHTRRPTPAMAPVSAAPTHTAPHFVLVGGIWIPPPEYTAAAAAAAAAASQPTPAPDGPRFGVPATGTSTSPKPPSSPAQGCLKQVATKSAPTTARSPTQPQTKAVAHDDAGKGAADPSSPATSSTSSRTGTTASPSTH